MDARVVVLTLLAGVLAGCTDFSDSGGDLQIRSLDVSAPEVGAGRFVLAVSVALDNEGGRSGPVNVTVKAYDAATGLLVGTATTSAGRLAKERTHAIEVRIDLPRANGYRLTVDVDEDDLLVYRTTVNAGNLANLEPNLYDTGLRVEVNDFRVLDTAGERTQVHAAVYLTNEGASDSRPLSLQVKAREQSTGLISDDNWVPVGAIRRDATRSINTTLGLSPGYNYDIEATLWDGDIIVERGSGEVLFAPKTTTSPGQSVVVTTPDLGDLAFDRGSGDSKSSKTPGLGFVAAALALVGVVFVRRRLA
ncbi:MAG: hypothetical protein AABY18_00755 [Candidatus Thermoplasmatota archaeon]